MAFVSVFCILASILPTKKLGRGVQCYLRQMLGRGHNNHVVEQHNNSSSLLIQLTICCGNLQLFYKATGLARMAPACFVMKPTIEAEAGFVGGKTSDLRG